MLAFSFKACTSWVFTCPRTFEEMVRRSCGMLVGLVCTALRSS